MNRRSFTLIEIIVATVLLALVIVGLNNVFVAAKGYILHSRSRMAGGELGKYFLDPLQMQVRQDNWNSTANDYVSTNLLHKHIREAASSLTLDNRTYTPYYTVTVPPDPAFPSSSPMRKVKVEIEWIEPR